MRSTAWPEGGGKIRWRGNMGIEAIEGNKESKRRWPRDDDEKEARGSPQPGMEEPAASRTV